MKESALLTDLYQLTMIAGYYENKMDETASFELFVRNYPPNRNYFVAAGLEQILDYILNLRFSDDEIEFIKTHKVFNDVGDDFFNYLKNFKFTGDIWAIPEGTIFFAQEPVIRITAPIIQAQLLETYILSMFNFQTMIATKTSQITCQAGNRKVVEFGSRRAHGPEAGVLAARASYIGGCMGTSNVYAGYKFNIPVYGTTAHSWIMAFDDELESFEKYYKLFPNNAILLVDTFDTLEGVRKATRVSPDIKGIRLDSGDLCSLSIEARKILDNAGLKNAVIVASGDLNEDKIRDLIEKNAPIDIFGVGTELSTSADAPFLAGVYKLVEVEKNNQSIPKAKFSDKKATYPGKKQVWRVFENNRFIKDIIADISEKPHDSALPLLNQVVRQGVQIIPNPDMDTIKAHYKNSLSSIAFPVEGKVEISDNLHNKYNNLKNSL